MACRLFGLAATLPFLMLHALPAAAATITFSPSANISGDNNVFNAGELTYGYDWSTSQTLNGVPFTATTSFTSVGGGNLSLSGFTAANATAFTSTSAPFTNLTTAYKAMLVGSVFNGTANTLGTLTLNNLAVGRKYQVQVWVGDPRSGNTTNRVEWIYDGNGGPTNLLTFNVGGTNGGVGQFTLGAFTADGGSQNITLDTAAPGNPNNNNVPQLNAIQLRDVTGVWSGTTSGNWADTDAASANFSGLSFSGVKTLSVTNVYFGDKDGAGNALAASAITVGAGGASGVNAIFQNASVAYTLNSADSTGIAGANGVTLNGTGSVTLNGANSYSGNTTVNAGTLVLGNAGALGSSAAVVLNGGTLDASALAALSLSSSQSLRGSGTVNGSVAAAAGATINPGGTGAAGTLAITNNLTLNGQALTFDLGFTPSGCDRILVGNTITVNGTCTLSLNYLFGSLYGGTYTLMTFGSMTGSGTFVLDTSYPGVTLNVNPTNVTLTVAGGGGTVGVWTNLLGGTWIAATNWQGNVVASNVDAVADFSTLNITAARTVTINTTNITIGHLVFGDTVQDSNWTLSTGTNTLAVSSGSPKIIINNGQSTTISAALRGTQGFTKLGSGTLTLSGANKFTGPVNVNGGTLVIGAAAGLGANADSSAAPVTLSNTTFQVTGAFLLTNNLVLPAGTSNFISQLNSSAGLYGTAGNALNGGGILTLNAAGQNPRLNGGANHNFTGTLIVNSTGAGGLLTAFDDNTALPGYGTAGSSNATYVFNGGGSSLTYMATSDWVAGGRAGCTNYIGELGGNATLYANNGRSGTTTLEIGARNTDSSFSGSFKDNHLGVTPYTPMIIRKVGSGSLNLSGASTYTGATDVRRGSLVVSGSLGVTPVSVQSGATFELDGSVTSPTITVNSGSTFVLGASAVLGSAAVSLNGLMDVTASAGFFNLGSATLSGSGVVAGAVTLVTASINPGPVGAAGTLTITNGDFTATAGTLNFDLSNDPTNGVNDLLVVNGNLNLNSPGVIININKLVGTLGGGNYPLITFSGAFNGSLANLTLTGANPLDTLQVNGNQLQLVVSPVANVVWTGGAAGNLWDIITSTNWLLNGLPSTFTNGESATFNNSGATNPVVTIPATVTPAAVLVNSASNYTFAGAADIAGGTSLTKSGPGTLTILNANTFLGSTFVNSGTLKLGDGTVSNGSLAGNIADSATLVIANPADQTYGGVISGAGTFIKQGAGNLTLTGNSILSGPTTISAGTLSLGDGVSTGSLGRGPVTNIATFTINCASSVTITNAIRNQGLLMNLAAGPVVFAGAVSGTGSLTNASTGTSLELAASNTYSGGTYISGGNVMLRNPSGFGIGDVVMDDFGTGVIDIAPAGGATTVIPNNIHLPAQTTPQFVVTDLSLTSMGTVRLPGIISGGASGQDTRIVNGGGSPAGNSRLTLILENPLNTFTMNPEVYSGCLAFKSDGALGNANNGITVRASTTAPFGDTLALIGLRFDANNIVLNANRTINLIGTENINVQTNSGTIAGPVTGLGLNKLGAGTLTINGPGSLTGTTTVSAGTMMVNSNWAGASLNVNSGATLAGTGTIEPDVTIASGATLAPGASIGTLTVTNILSLSSGSTTVMEINAGTLACDKVVGLNTLNYGGTLNVVNTGGTFAAGQTFSLFTSASYTGSFATTNLPALDPSLRWQWNPANGTLAVVAGVATNPTNLTLLVSGGNLNLSWPADHTGWRLEAQTNNASSGLSTNWSTWPGSTSVNSVSVPIDSSNPSVFFRLVYP